MITKYHVLFITLLFSAIINELFSQPGDEYGEHRLRQFQIVQDSLAEYPNNCLYRWASLELLFSPRFDLDTPPEESLADYFYKNHYYSPDSIDIYIHQPCDMCPSKHLTIPNPNKTVDSILLFETDFLTEIDQLIDQNCDLKKWMMLYVGRYDHEANKASFLYKKGQYYYLTGEPEKALETYLAALENDPSKRIKEDICLSIAAYYYNLNTPDILTRHRLALKYIDLVTPQKYDTIPRLIEKYGSHNYDRFEREKIRLLTSINDSTRLVNYLQNLSASHFAYYLKSLDDSPPDDWADYHITETLRMAHYYEQQIYQYLKNNSPSDNEATFRLQLRTIMNKL